MFLITLFGVLTSTAAEAHTGGSQGWLHPLTGMDHLLAMIAVGAWSSQMGGRAIWIVPSAFVACMLLGGLLGFELIELPGVEIGISLSVILLGLAIGLERTFPVAIAALGVGIFGIFHGYAHGYEMPVMDNKLAYTSGFLATTASLHVFGAISALLLLKLAHGRIVLRILGFVCALLGIYLMFQL
ncbi:HupE/UreJ family protein [Halomonas binhaiensis]|uniref:HupE/UreJ family protein n=1 Tax=Halomonas binhaiensis TaxID=2562282 RepID=A0A856QQL5_9GAMM|nr:HupE/UreJ family protein [Halomonas binhaiensis]QEM82159.2 HupE/UreJ family protein [Halomonas binhaiensis]